MKRLTLFLLPALLLSCGGNKSNETSVTETISEETFYETQPVVSGLYDAESYDITGTNPRKGKFDGRIYFSLSPEMSAFYVFENGNRTKIDHIVTLKRPFEKNDSGIYVSVDAKELPVTVTPDSIYILEFNKGAENLKIGFNPKPRHTGTAVEILERMSAQKNKK